ncbi:MFS transporter [Amorphus sp. 3PC139-8]|uniref:MFS transporter n=1 Tax=Amorphus sp. 3PC139-8 TaxID=2735676 RepID=UPI00345DF1A9
MRRFDLIILGFVTVILAAALAVISWQSIRSAENTLMPALDRKADVVARSLASLVGEAVGYGIALDEIVGGDQVLRTVLSENPEFGFAAITNAAGRIVASAQTDREGGVAPLERQMRTVTQPVVVNGATVGSIVVGIPNAVAETLLRRLWIDIAVLLLVSLLVTLELLSFAFTMPTASLLRGLARRLEALGRHDFRPHDPLGGAGPLAGEVATVDREIARVRREHAELMAQAEAAGDTDALRELQAIDRRFRLTRERTDPPINLVAVRAPVFLFFFAEEMARPFLPSYIQSFAKPIAGLSIEMVISLPIVIFMAIVALAQPTLNGITERAGRGRSLRTGALLALIGYVGTAYAWGMVPLIVFRSVTAIGLATVFVSAQGYIVDRTGAQNRARGIGLFVSGIMVAMLCGPPIGGILADRLGIAAAFLVSAAMCLAAYLCALVALSGDRPNPTAAIGGVSIRQIGSVLKRPQMLTLLVGCALPAKMLLIGFCFYYLPLSLSSAGFDPATIGRVLMLYGLAMVVVIPLVSRLSDDGGRRVSFVVVGALLSGLAIAHLYLWPAPWGAALAVLQVGIAQGLSTTPQSALVGELGARYVPSLSQGSLYGVFRFIERSGTAIGPAIVAFLWGAYGGEVAVMAIAGMVALGGALFALAAIGGSEPKPTPVATR